MCVRLNIRRMAEAGRTKLCLMHSPESSTNTILLIEFPAAGFSSSVRHLTIANRMVAMPRMDAEYVSREL